MAHNGDILITIPVQTINEMLLVPLIDFLTQFSLEALTDLYHKLTFPQRAQIFKIVFPEDAEFPKRNPPYSSTMFLEASGHCISLLSYLLGYRDNQSIDEVILGLLSIFNKDQQSTFMYNYNQFLDDNIHEQFMNFIVQGVFNYNFVIIYMLIFQQGNLSPIRLSKQEEQGVNQSVIQWK